MKKLLFAILDHVPATEEFLAAFDPEQLGDKEHE